MMASHRRTSGVKARTMGPTSSVTTKVTSHTSSTKQRTHPIKPKYKKPKSSMSITQSICYYKNYIVCLCLSIWTLSIIIYLIYAYKSSHPSTPPIMRSINKTKHDLFINNKEPAWKHAIQPWDILPRPPKGPPPPMKCTWEGPKDGFLAGCANDNCRNVNGFDVAKGQCVKDELCTGLVKVLKDKEIYQLRSGGKVSDSPSGEQSWQKKCEVDQDKMNEMHKDAMQKLDGKGVDGKGVDDIGRNDHNNNNNNKDWMKKEIDSRKKMDSKLMKRMDSKQSENNKDIENPLNNEKAVNIKDIDYIKQSIESHRNKGMDDIAIKEDDPWSKFIPPMAKNNRGSHHVYDDNDVRGGYQRPFGGGMDDEVIGELNIDEKEENLKKELLDPASSCFLEGPIDGFIANCADDNCENHQVLDVAIDKCLEETSCTGVVQIVSGQSIYQLRSDKKLRDSPRGEVTWVKLCGDKALHRIREIASETPPPQCFLDGPIRGFLGNCAGKECKRYYYFNDAMIECENMGKLQCVGVTRIPGLKKSFELRAIAPVISSDSGEYSYLMECGDEDNDNDNDDDDKSKQPMIDPMDDPLISEYEKIGKIIQIDDHHTNEVVELETIFIGIASYRDSWCYKSVHTAFARARYPERIFIGVVQQNIDDDPECITPQIPCDEDPTQVLCKYVDHIRVKRFDARNAAGPTFGRHHADTLYDGEYFAVQVDAHMSFIKDWDMIAINQWNKLSNEYAILSTYPSEIKSGLDEYGNPLTESAPIICNTRLLHNGMFKHEAAGEIKFPESHKDKPMLSPFLGAGILFSRGHRIVRVPYDCCLPMIFDGEEFSMGARVWTHGYDLYAPAKSFSYHPYNRKKRPPLFWENQDGGRSKRSQNRIKKILGMKLEKGQETNYDNTDIERYGLGKQRTFDKFLKVFGINLETKEIYNHCAEAFAGILHDRLHAYLRPNKRGINYQYVYIPQDAKDNDDDNGDNDNNNNDENQQNIKQKRTKSYLNIKDQKEVKKKIDDDDE